MYKCSSVQSGGLTFVLAPKTLNGITDPLSIKHNLLSLLKLCSSTKHLSQLHARIHFFGLQRDSHLLAEFVRFCAISPGKNLTRARALVDHYSNDSATISWNFLVRGYVSVDSSTESVRAYREMRRRGVRPNNLTFPFVFKACAAITNLDQGNQVRVDAFKFGVDDDVYVGNTLIHFLGACKRISDARRVFDEMPERTIVSWNSIITACVDSSCFTDSLIYFTKMIKEGFEPDQTTTVLLLSASAELGNLSLGRRVHSQIIVRGMVINSKLGTALVDMYAKSGNLGYAESVFERLKDRNVWTWSAMILGLARHGHAEEALDLFSGMTSRSVAPNHVTLLGVLCACSHAGLVEAARRHFREMRSVHGIEPGLAHYGAMVDVLGRAGRLGEAHGFVADMAVEPDAVVWRTLLGAGGAHGDVARERLLAVEPRRTGNLVMAANMYAAAGMWDEAAGVRSAMRRAGMRKPAGQSSVEVAGLARSFMCGYDISRPGDEAVYGLVRLLNLQMKMTPEQI